jgi:hypothetical protein
VVGETRTATLGLRMSRQATRRVKREKVASWRGVADCASSVPGWLQGVAMTMRLVHPAPDWM